MTHDLLRHIAAVRNAVLPGGRLPFRLGPDQVGWLRPDFAAQVVDAGARQCCGSVTLDDPDALPGLARRLAQSGAYRWRDEAFDVRATPEGAVLAQVDRGALPAFGLLAHGVHLNGLVRRGGGTKVWVARRAANRPIDPGKLDNLVAGGVPSGCDARETLEKEAREEAGLAAEALMGARRVATLAYVMERPEGLRRDHLACYDLDLPDGFVPQPMDGEAESFELWPLQRVADRLRRTDDFKFNVSLVLIDLLLRERVIDPDGEEARTLRAALDAPLAHPR